MEYMEVSPLGLLITSVDDIIFLLSHVSNSQLDLLIFKMHFLRENQFCLELLFRFPSVSCQV